MLGRLGQKNVGLSGKGGLPVLKPPPKPSPRPPGGRTVVGVPPLFPEPMRVVAPTGGIPGGPRGGVSTPVKCPPPGGPLKDPEVVCEEGIIGPRPPRPKLVELPSDDCWL